MSFFSKQDFKKHDYKYSLTLLNMIEEGKEIPIGEKGLDGKVIIDKNSKYIKVFEKSINENKELPEGSFDVIKSQLKIPFTKIFKGTFSGCVSSSVKVPSGLNVDDAREVSVAVISLALINGIYEKTSILEFAKNLKKSDIVGRKLKVSKNLDLEKVYQFLFDNPKKFDVALSCAETIILNFKNIKNFTFHHKDDYFFRIKKMGVKLSKLKEDKWNPADLILSRNPNENIPLSINNLVDFNKWCSDGSNRLMISLKEGETAALHGAVSLGTLITEMGFNERLGSLGSSFRKFDDNLSNFFERSLKKLRNFKNIHCVIPKGCKTIKESVFAMSLKKDISSNFFNSIPVIIDFMSRHENDLVKIIENAYIFSKSITDRSCSYHKIMGKKYGFVSFCNEKIDIKNIYILLNGETQVVFNLIANGKPIMLQCRSKGSKPQFSILNKVYSPNSLKNEVFRIDQIL